MHAPTRTLPSARTLPQLELCPSQGRFPARAEFQQGKGSKKWGRVPARAEIQPVLSHAIYTHLDRNLGRNEACMYDYSTQYIFQLTPMEKFIIIWRTITYNPKGFICLYTSLIESKDHCISKMNISCHLEYFPFSFTPLNLCFGFGSC